MQLTTDNIEDQAERGVAAERRPSRRPVRRGGCADARAGHPDASSTAPPPDATTVPEAVDPGRQTNVLRRVLVALGLATATVTLVLALPPLRSVAREIAHANPAWVGVALALELASCAAYVVIFRLFFPGVSAGLARELAWAEEASGALLPTGGLGALAIGGVLLRRAGMSTRRIVESSSALFFLTSAMNVGVLVAGGLLLGTGALGGRDTFLLAAIPVALGVVSTAATLALPALLRRSPERHWPSWLIDIANGIDAARHSLRRPSWRMVGAVGYLGFDIAALGVTFAATGHPVPIDALVLGYIIGYLANILPVPGGFGVLEAGLAGTLILYGAPATQAAAAVVIYHAIAFWIPSLGGLLGWAALRRRDLTANQPEEPGRPAQRRPSRLTLPRPATPTGDQPVPVPR